MPKEKCANPGQLFRAFGPHQQGAAQFLPGTAGLKYSLVALSSCGFGSTVLYGPSARNTPHVFQHSHNYPHASTMYTAHLAEYTSLD